METTPDPSAQDYTRVHSFTQEENATILDAVSKGMDYVTVALALQVQPSLVYLQGVGIGATWNAGHDSPMLGADGYWLLPPLVSVQNHPIYKDRPVSRSAWVQEHRWIAALHYSQLLQGQQVHHIDFSKTNNNPENLWVCSAAEHLRAQNSLQGLVVDLLESRAVRFDRATGHYVVVGELAQLLYKK